MTIRRKLTLWHAGLLALIIAVFGAAIFGVTRWTMIGTVDTNLERIADEVVENIHIVSVGQFGASRTAVVFREQDVFHAPGISIQVWQTRDQDEYIMPVLIKASGLADFEGVLDGANIGTREPIFNDVTLNSIASRVHTMPYTDGRYGVGVVQVAAPVQTIRQAIEQLLTLMFISSLVTIACAIAIGAWLSNRALQPLDNIVQAAVKIATTDDLSTRLPLQGVVGEAGRLTRAFNHMMERLEHLFKVEQRFVADVSHELRTPLTAIRGNLEIIKRYGMDDDSLEAIDSEVQRMSRLVTDLLLLARADYGEVIVDLYPLDLDTVVSEVFQQAKMLSKNRDLEVTVGHFVPIRVKGNTDRLKQLLLNLLSNAIKFTPDGGKVTIGLQPRGGWAVIYIEDTGIGIEPENLDHIFDRFYQAEPSRTHKNSQSGGIGLGLSIARWIVDAHGGKLSVESEVGAGTTFRVRLPILGKVQIKPLEIPEDKLYLPVGGEK